MAEDQRFFIYRIDQSDRINFANQEWFDFARENNAMALRPDAVIGSLLWNYISDEETRRLFQVLLGKVRETGAPVALPYRCDSGDCRRFMEMKIVPMPDRQVGFYSRILRDEPREKVRLMEPHAERTDGVLVMCSWCKKIPLPDGRWVEVEEAVKALNLFDAPRLPMISHTMCPECAAAFVKDAGITQ